MMGSGGRGVKVCGVTANSKPAGGGGRGGAGENRIPLQIQVDVLKDWLSQLEERVYRLENPEEFDDRAILEECEQ